MTIARRIRLSRAKGFDLQEASKKLNGLSAINIARPGPLGNPFVVGKDGTRAECLHLFRMMLGGQIAISTKASVESQQAVLNYIAGKRDALRNCNLACWCALDAPCHGDALLELFNGRMAPSRKTAGLFDDR